jgi:hypothetical protein
MAAEIDERHALDARTFVEIVVWQLPRPVRGSVHPFKYRLALVVDESVCCDMTMRRAKATAGTFGIRSAVIASLIPTHYSRISGATLKS